MTAASALDSCSALRKRSRCWLHAKSKMAFDSEWGKARIANSPGAVPSEGRTHAEMKGTASHCTVGVKRGLRQRSAQAMSQRGRRRRLLVRLAWTCEKWLSW